MNIAVTAARSRVRNAIYAVLLIAPLSLVACGDDIAPPNEASGDTDLTSEADAGSQSRDDSRGDRPSFDPPTVTPDDEQPDEDQPGPIADDTNEPDESDETDTGSYEPTPIDDAGTPDESGSDDGSTDDAGSTDDSDSSDDWGNWDAGQTDDGQTDDGQTDDGPTDDGSNDSTDAGSGGSSGSGSGGSSGSGGAIDCRDASTWPAAWVAYEDQVLQLTNAERAAGASCGGSFYSPQPPLTMDPQLREAARCHSMDMAVQNYFSHTSANGDSMSDRVNATGYAWRSLGENIAAGYNSPSATTSGWMTSSGHCRNIMSGFSELGVGYYGGSSGYGHYWTQNFATPSGGSSNTGGWSGGWSGGSGSDDSGSRTDAGSYDAGSSTDAGSYDAGSSTDTGSSSGGGSAALDCRDASTWPADWVAYEDTILQLTNSERAAGASCGGSFYSPQPALTMDPQLREAARCHSLDMAVQDYFSHTSANGDSMSDRVNATGYAWRSIGENIAAGYGTTSAAMTGWMNSSGHCSNIMSGFTEIGVGYVYWDTNRYGHYWTQNFGIPR